MHHFLIPCHLIQAISSLYSCWKLKNFAVLHTSPKTGCFGIPHISFFVCHKRWLWSILVFELCTYCVIPFEQCVIHNNARQCEKPKPTISYQDSYQCITVVKIFALQIPQSKIVDSPFKVTYVFVDWKMSQRTQRTMSEILLNSMPLTSTQKS